MFYNIATMGKCFIAFCNHDLHCSLWDRVFVHGKPFKPCLTFASQAGVKSEATFSFSPLGKALSLTLKH